MGAQGVDITVGTVSGAFGHSTAAFSISVDAAGGATVHICLIDQDGRKSPTILSLGAQQYADFWNVMRGTHDMLARMTQMGQIRFHQNYPNG